MKQIYPLLFVIGLLMGGVLIDGPSHVIFHRFYFHNIYFPLFCLGATVGLIFNYFKEEICTL